MNYDEDIRNIFGSAMGSDIIICNCGRTNFCSFGASTESEELKQLEAQAKAAPTRYCIHYGCDSVSAVNFNGTTRVFGCTCDWTGQLGRFLDANERPFVEYYKQKLKRVQRQLAESAAILAALEGNGTQDRPHVSVSEALSAPYGGGAPVDRREDPYKAVTRDLLG